MRLKYKVLIIIFAVLIATFSAGITYSMFRSDIKLNSDDQKIAKFVVNAESLDELNISLVDLVPGSSKEYNFSVSNTLTTNISDVTIQYELIIKTYHFVPITIELYKIEDKNESLILDCNETDFKRNELNELTCKSNKYELAHTNTNMDNYKLKVTFPIEYNSLEYSDLVDYINIELNSSQK